MESRDENDRELNGLRIISTENETHGVSATLHYPIVTEPRRKTSPGYSNGFSTLRRGYSTVQKATKDFLGLNNEYNNGSSEQLLWTERRIRLATRQYGGVVPDKISSTLPRRPRGVDSPDGGGDRIPISTSTLPPRLKPSFGDYLLTGLSTVGRKIRGDKSSSGQRQPKSRSYVPESLEADPEPEHPVTDASRLKPEIPEIFFDREEREEERQHLPIRFDEEKPQGERLGLSRLQLLPQDVVDRREFGIGVVGEAFGRDYKTMVRNQPHVRIQMDEMDDYRPYFTYWVTTVQIVIMIVTLALYGFGPVGVELASNTGQVMAQGLYLEDVDYQEPASFWFGPRAADLIHLGAKFSPCMRQDELILKEKATQVTRESDTGCCIRNDYSGCSQTSREECSTLLSVFHKWSPDQPGPDGRISGPVCGQDPLYCTAPLSSYTNTWPDNITQWPVCHVTSVKKPISFLSMERYLSPAPKHMTCERISRPCCIGIHGRCEIRTQEYCDFVKGHFHPEATLCSQVSCMEDVCGMLPFFDSSVPDQFYRVWLSLFLHAGLLHLAISIIFQLYLMRDMEKLCGPLRMALIYFGSGIVGNLASAIFIPYRAESGPAGAQFGILATLIVEVVNVWSALKAPHIAIGKLLSILCILFCLGLMPWVDNYAHIFGFISGFLLSYAVMPYVSFDKSANSQAIRILLIAACLCMYALVLTALLVVFYAVESGECEWCKYVTCIPFTRDFCADQNINFKKDDPIISF